MSKTNIKRVIRQKATLLGDVKHSTKVTRIGNWWHCRVFVNDVANQEVKVADRSLIGRAFKEMLRDEDKSGNISELAESTRKRSYSKI